MTDNFCKGRETPPTKDHGDANKLWLPHKFAESSHSDSVPACESIPDIKPNHQMLSQITENFPAMDSAHELQDLLKTSILSSNNADLPCLYPDGQFRGQLNYACYYDTQLNTVDSNVSLNFIL